MIVALLQENYELVVILGLVLRALRAWQTELTWPEYRAIHRVKRGVFPAYMRLSKAVALLPSLPLVYDKNGRDDAEFIATVDAPLRRTVKSLRASGGTLHVLNSLKRRPDTHGDPYTAAHVVWYVGGDQVEAYLFRNDDGTVDVHAHTETSTDDPLGHLTDEQINGDKYGVLPTLKPSA
jgi:hypothetical protein